MLLWKMYQNVCKHMERYCQLRYYIKNESSYCDILNP